MNKFTLLEASLSCAHPFDCHLYAKDDTDIIGSRQHAQHAMAFNPIKICDAKDTRERVDGDR